MTPAEHYAEAERLMREANYRDGADLARFKLAEAQVHATLATIHPDVLWPLRGSGITDPSVTDRPADGGT